MIIQAINDKNVMTISYKDKDRTVEPHAFGVSTKGKLLVRAWQRGEGGGWKLFDFEAMSDIVYLKDTFGTRPGYKPGDSAMNRVILAEV